jgi:hypothetical protein
VWTKNKENFKFVCKEVAAEQLFEMMRNGASAMASQQISPSASPTATQTSSARKPRLVADREHRVLTVRVATWNSGNARPPADLRPLFAGRPGGAAAEAADADLVVFGQQESTFRLDAKGEPGAGEGVESYKGASKVIGTLKGSVGSSGDAALDGFWHSAMATALGDGYLPVRSVSLGEMRLSIWARKELHGQIDDVEDAREACGIGGVVGNKGGLVVKLRVCETTLCFISSHLAAHEGEKKAAKRNADIREILAGARLGRQPWLDCSLQFDHCFWLGDLNYRIDLQQLDGVARTDEEHRSEVLASITDENWPVMLDADQLHRCELEQPRRPISHGGVGGCLWC